ncbi:MAG TPA: hypothetical protein VLK65_20695 [Vicinamibacteria bacterium]|nr:hypothetical protein [Vicinamibacteria bacterium]
MRFAYYQKLTPSQKKIYDESDRIVSVPLYRPAIHRERSASLALVLATGDRLATERWAQALCDGLTEAFGVPALEVGVMERRPSWRTGELHGLYEAGSPGLYKISLWMRTARRAHVVKFKTFLRTLLHELCHHLDYHRFRLRDSFHTAGFYRRESSLMRQLLPGETAPKRAGSTRLAQDSNRGIE